MCRLLSSVLLMLLLGPAFGGPSFDVRTEGAALTQAFYADQIEKVWARMDAKMQSALKSRAALAAFRAQIRSQLGNESAVLNESVSTEQGVSVYRRRVRFEKIPNDIIVMWAFSADGRVAGFRINPDQSAPPSAAPSAHLDYVTKSTLRLPFDDTFFVFWGGRTIEQNYHAVDANQRFAYDLLIIRDGVTHVGNGRRNEDYFCFGRPILAPAAGEIVDVIRDVDDNVPGQLNAEQATGNRVVIDHGHGEFSLLAHLRRGSLRVKSGDRVASGDHLGDCGNSGHSTEPHLHYQLQNGPQFGSSAGLPAQFMNYIADETPVARGEPAKGQTIRPVK